jgi:deoxyribose-phosphate aldolase
MKYNKYIDHTNLKADATTDDIKRLCNEAKLYNFMSVCVHPHYVSLCHELLKNTKVKVCTVIGFPLGSNTTATKLFETINALMNGADEIDMVINISWLKANHLKQCVDEIASIKKACQNKVLKVIVETALLSTSDKINACKCVNMAQADFIKTSTGFSSSGATVEDIKLFLKHIKPGIKIKASGGIKTREQMLAMIKAGATRIGTSNGVNLI